MPAVDVELYVSGDAVFTAFASASLPESLGLAGSSSFFANPSLDGTDGMFLQGEGFFTAVALLRKAFVPGPPAGKAPPNQFPGLQVGRQPARRTSSATIDTNPQRRRRPPEEPER
jgi:hypothetical protein